jgi:hypothetical protein
MKRRSRSRVASIILVIFAFAQLGTAFAECLMDRSDMAATMSADGMPPCDGCDPAPAAKSQLQNLCVAHCTADLQLSGALPSRIGAAVPPAVLKIAARQVVVDSALALDVQPPHGPPRRILLHSFLI